MKKEHIIILLILLILVMLGWFYMRGAGMFSLQVITPSPSPSGSASITPSPTTNIETVAPESNGLRAQLLSAAYVEVPGVEPRTVVRLAGDVTEYGDFTNEPEEPFGDIALGPVVLGSQDLMFTTLTINTGGTGNFTYVVAFVPGSNGYQVSGYEWLEDRVIVENFSLSEGNIVTVDYLQHGPNQAMAERPNQKVNLRLRYDEGKFTKI